MIFIWMWETTKSFGGLRIQNRCQLFRAGCWCYVTEVPTNRFFKIHFGPIKNVIYLSGVYDGNTISFCAPRRGNTKYLLYIQSRKDEAIRGMTRNQEQKAIIISGKRSEYSMAIRVSKLPLVVAVRTPLSTNFSSNATSSGSAISFQDKDAL